MVNGDRRKAHAWRKQDRPRTSRAGQRPVIKSHTGYDIGSYILVLVAVFLAGMLAGPWLFGPGKVTPAAEQAWRESALLDDAIVMTMFWQRRHTLMWRAAFTRFDWTEDELKLALVKLEKARPEFESVAKVIDQLGKEGMTIALLEKRMQALRSRIESFCEEFGLDCPRGYPPDQATIRRDRYQALGPTPGAFLFVCLRAVRRVVTNK